ncbi:MAG: response regulator [Anaerolineales bacterium]
MAEPIRLLLADDHALFRRGIMELLKEREDMELLGAAADGTEIVQMAHEFEPDVILMDVHMPAGGGVEAVRSIKGALDSRVLMLTVSPKDEDLLSAIEAGADGYLLKNAEPEALFQAIHHVAAGKAVLSPEVAGKIMRRAVSTKPEPTVELTPRELEVLKLVAAGKTTAQIAFSLKIADSTVKTHVSHILKKLNAANRTEAVARATQQGLLSSQ